MKWILAALLVASGALGAVLCIEERREDARKLAECAEVKRECRMIVTTCINSLP